MPKGQRGHSASLPHAPSLFVFVLCGRQKTCFIPKYNVAPVWGNIASPVGLTARTRALPHAGPPCVRRSQPKSAPFLTSRRASLFYFFILYLRRRRAFSATARWVRAVNRSIPTQWGSIRFRPPICTSTPRGVRVRVDELAKSLKI